MEPTILRAQTRRGLCEQDFEGTKPADLPVEQPTKFEFICDQFEDGETDWCDDSAERAGKSGPGNQMTVQAGSSEQQKHWRN